MPDGLGLSRNTLVAGFHNFKDPMVEKGIMKILAKIGIIASLLLIAIPIITATSPLQGTSGTITVGSAPPVIISSATIGTSSCTITNQNTTFTCPNNAIPGVGQTETLTINIKNVAVVSQSVPAPTVTFASTNTSTSSVLSIAGNCPTALGTGTSSTGTCTFTIQGLTTGSDSFTLTI